MRLANSRTSNSAAGAVRLTGLSYPPTFGSVPDRGVKIMVIRLRACLLAAGTIAAASAALASAAVGAENNIIRIGALLPMSGPGSYFGAQDRQGIELALDAINKSGVRGYKFEV